MILASATPHNGKPESFAELVQLLDPTAIVDRTKYTAKDIEHLYVRRHRNSPDVKLEVAHKWRNNDALQGFSKSSLIQWRPTSSANSRTPGCILRVNRWSPAKADNCFPGPCLRPFCRHQKLCASSIKRRIATIGDASTPEVKALRRLDDLAEKAQASTPSKLIRLVEHLRAIGIANNSDVRVVIFSERIDTLTWLQQEVTKRLKLPANAVETLHAGLPDEKITDVPESFGQSGSDIRVLLASDMASEGLNLHQDATSWSTMTCLGPSSRIQQRNGRIDRYGQLHEPQISALALAGDDDVTSDVRVVTKLLQKEYEANMALGDAGVLLDLHDAEIEEREVIKAIRDGKDLDAIMPEPIPSALNPFAALMATEEGSTKPDRTPETVPEHSLFDDDDNFLIDELADAATEIGSHILDIHRDADKDLIAFTPPAERPDRAVPGTSRPSTLRSSRSTSGYGSPAARNMPKNALTGHARRPTAPGPMFTSCLRSTPYSIGRPNVRSRGSGATRYPYSVAMCLNQCS